MTEENLRVMGFDVYSDPVRRATAEHLHDTNEPIMTGPRKLLSNEKIGFTIILPVYHGGRPLISQEDRRAALQGVVSIAFEASDFFSDALKSVVAENEIAVRIYDVTDAREPKPENMLYRSPKASSEIGHRKAVVRDVAGRKLLYSFEAPYFALKTTTGRAGLNMVLVGGFVFSLMLFFVLYSYASARKRAVVIAEVAIRDLKAQAEELARGTRKLEELNRALRDEVQRREKFENELLASKDELERTVKLMVGRELKMKELKDEIRKGDKKE